MASVFLDGFAHYATANIYQKYTNTGGTIAIDPSPPPGRVGPALHLTFGTVSKTLTYKDSWIQGFALYAADLSGGLISWSSAGRQTLFNLRIEPDGTLSMYAGNSGNPAFLIANTSSFSIQENTWYYIEMKFSFTGSTPIAVTAELRVNGTVRASGSKNTNVNQSDTLLNLTAVNAFDYEANGNRWFKDAYVFDDTGGINDDYAGDVTFQTVFPDGDVTTQWTPTGGGTSFDQINSNPPNPATYVEDGTAGEKDNFTWQDIPPTFKIVAVQYDVLAQKTAEGTKTMKVFVGPTGSEELFGPEIWLSDDPVYFTLPMDVDPGTSAPWTVPNFNSKNFGFEVFS